MLGCASILTLLQIKKSNFLYRISDHNIEIDIPFQTRRNGIRMFRPIASSPSSIPQNQREAPLPAGMSRWCSGIAVRHVTEGSCMGSIRTRHIFVFSKTFSRYYKPSFKFICLVAINVYPSLDPVYFFEAYIGVTRWFNRPHSIYIFIFSICQRGEYHSTRALIGSSDAGYPVLSTSGRSSVTARVYSSHF